MSENTWQTVRLGNISHVEHGWPFRSDDFVEFDGKSPIVLAIGNFNYTGGFRLQSSNIKAYRGEYPKKFETSPGDIMLVMTCQTAGGEILGIPARVPEGGRTYLHNQRIGKFIVDNPSKLCADYFYHWARTADFNGQLFLTATGTKILHTSPGRISRACIPLPPLLEQQKIVKILNALDDKIAANALVVTKVDELANSTWLLACSNGSTAPLSSLARFVNGKAFTKDASGAGRVVIRIAELNSGIGGSTVYNDIDVPEDHLARPGDLLFAWSGSLTVARWFREEAIVNQHIFKVIPADSYPTWLVNQALTDKLQEFRAIAADKATTMGHIQRHHLDEPVAVPDRNQINQFNDLMSALWERALAAEQENLRLESTRDQLLPLLMSGKVRVRDAEKVVEGVV